MNNNKAYIIQEINNLKKDIQNLINDKKTAENSFIIKKYDEDKKLKMDKLKKFTEQLKVIYKKEREAKQVKNDLESVGKELDSLNFRNAKNNSDKTKAKLAKEQRQQAHNKYLEYLKLEESYFQNDPKALPGILFLNQKIISEYGMCPYILQEDKYKQQNNEQQDDEQDDKQYDNQKDEQKDDEHRNEQGNKEESTFNQDKFNQDKLDPDITDYIYNKRLEWLSSQKDNGELYYNLYDKLINKKELVLANNDKLNLENKMDKFIEDILTEDQYKLWNKCLNFIDKYVESNIKTKRLKESFKVFIHDLSILYSEVSINFHKYLALKYNCQIDVNLLELKYNSDNNKNYNKKSNKNFVLSCEFDDLIIEYENVIEMVKVKEKYIKNTLKNLKQDLCLYLTSNNKDINGNISNMKSNKQTYVQVGKYFKRWILLTQEERLERFHSYALYYVQAFLIDKDIIDQSQRDDTVAILSELLKSAFVSKKMIYRDIKWNTTKGIIELVKILHYDKDSSGFILKYTKQIMEKLEGETNNIKKKLSFRTIITKDSEKIINEDLLYFIVNCIENGVQDITKQDKETFAEKIKLKLKIKRLTVNDKVKIFEKYDEIFNIVKNNKK